MPFTTLKYFIDMRSSFRRPYCNLAFLKRFCDFRLRSLIACASTVPYYRSLFAQSGVEPSHINSVEDLLAIPLSDKATLSLNMATCVDPKANMAACRVLRTSGSMGNPFSVISDLQEARARRLSSLRMQFLNTRKLYDKILVITTAQHYLRERLDRRIVQQFGILRECYISALSDPDQIISSLFAYRPDIIMGYSGQIKEVAMRMREKRQVLGSVRIIFLTGEILTAQNRSYIENTFGAQVFNYYSSSECGLIAWECLKHNGYHIDTDNVIVEVFDADGRPANEGEIAVTVLNNFTMPLIRFKLGDYAVLSNEPCGCGIQFPLLKKVIGRTNDSLVFFEDKKVSAYTLMHAMDGIAGLIRYRIFQESIDSIECFIETQPNLFAFCAHNAQQTLQLLVPEGVAVRIRQGNCQMEHYKRKIIINKLK